MTLNNPKQFHPKNIPFQIQSWGTREFFGRWHLKNCKYLSLFDTAERSSVVMQHG
jgi:hypothetical protein